VNRYTEVSYTDELLADGSVHRRFSDGRQEWRRRGPGPMVYWTDHGGDTGTDELLGARIVKRTFGNGQVHYGREQGYGRTAWPYGRLTVNRTSFGGRMGAILAAVGGGILLGSIVDPPLALTPLEEDQLRQQAQTQAQQSSSNDGGGGEWESGDDDFDDDFG
jgi:hypothetical protein